MRVDDGEQTDCAIYSQRLIYSQWFECGTFVNFFHLSQILGGYFDKDISGIPFSLCCRLHYG